MPRDQSDADDNDVDTAIPTRDFLLRTLPKIIGQWPPVPFLGKIQRSFGITKRTGRQDLIMNKNKANYPTGLAG